MNDVRRRVSCDICGCVCLYACVSDLAFHCSALSKGLSAVLSSASLLLLLLLPSLHYTSIYHHIHNIFPGLALDLVDITKVERVNASRTPHFTQRTMSSEELASMTFEAAIELPQ